MVLQEAQRASELVNSTPYNILDFKHNLTSIEKAEIKAEENKAEENNISYMSMNLS